jgi:hypothetical protein
MRKYGKTVRSSARISARKVMRKLFQVDVGYACFGLIVEDQTVIEAAPIAQWAVGKQAQKVFDYFLGKGGTIVEANNL